MKKSAKAMATAAVAALLLLPACDGPSSPPPGNPAANPATAAQTVDATAKPQATPGAEKTVARVIYFTSPT